MAGPKPLRTEFGIRQRLESCVPLSSEHVSDIENFDDVVSKIQNTLKDRNLRMNV